MHDINKKSLTVNDNTHNLPRNWFKGLSQTRVPEGNQDGEGKR